MTDFCDHGPDDTCPLCRPPTPRPTDLPRRVKCQPCNGRGRVPDLDFIGRVRGEKVCPPCHGVGSLAAP